MAPNKSLTGRVVDAVATKTCFTCRANLSATLEFFARRQSSRDGLRGQCRTCLQEQHRPNAQRWYQANREKARMYRRLYYEKEKASGVHQRRSREWRRRNWKRAREIEERYHGPMRRTPKGRITASIRSVICSSLKKKGGRSSGRLCSALPYSIEELMRHLRCRFHDGMSWGNYGKWHIDHVRPIASFDYASVDDPQFRQCWALENLRPLWALDNLRKGAAVAVLA